jgi:tryptophan synthase alpha chain
MSNIARAFAAPSTTVFIGFVSGGDPSIEKTEEFILEMERAGAGLVEIGIPFSDPIAEGPVIQEANIRALAAGARVDKLFDMVSRIRTKTALPLVFLSYLNPVFHYGYEAFFARCRSCGIDGIIIPDLPFEEQDELRNVSSKYGVDLISLIAPTSEERIAEIARKAEGFLYIVSSLGVTGVRNEIKTDLAAMIAQARAAAPGLPVAVGFGIHSPEQAAAIAGIADGVIVGSAIVRIIAEYGDRAGPHIYQYVRNMKAVL